jgi:hypothetical protein
MDMDRISVLQILFVSAGAISILWMLWSIARKNRLGLIDVPD